MKKYKLTNLIPISIDPINHNKNKSHGKLIKLFTEKDGTLSAIIKVNKKLK